MKGLERIGTMHSTGRVSVTFFPTMVSRMGNTLICPKATSVHMLHHVIGTLVYDAAGVSEIALNAIASKRNNRKKIDQCQLKMN